MKSIFLLLIATSVFAQNIVLKNSENQYDYVIITIEDFVPTCEVFKSHKEIFNNFSVLITTKDNILAEFSSTQTLQENIRNFISYAGSKWSNPKPKYFLFTADLDKIPNFKFKSISYVSNYDSSYSDYYYGLDTDNLDSTSINYIVGRIAARNTEELTNYFTKVINYETKEDLEPWNSRSLFVTDDEYAEPGNFEGDFFIRSAKNIASNLQNFINTDFVIPIDTSYYFGNTDSITSKLNSGVSSVFFSGHSTNEVFTHELLYTLSEISKLEDNGNPFFISMMGKQEFARTNRKSIVNEFMISTNGALVGINSVGTHFGGSATEYYKNVWSMLYTNKSIGEIFFESMNNNSSFSEKRKFNIFGDPSIVLKSDITADITDRINIPDYFELEQNYPNPFNPTTKINYNIPHNGNTTLKVYNVLGKEVVDLVNEYKQSGFYSINFDAGNLPSGVYFYMLSNGNFTKTKKMILLK